MSTFDGVIREFPGVRVDFFRGVVENAPLACFLSHIHSDHLAGLDTYKGRPVYCSAATRAMLLKLQRYTSRINFHQERLEKEEITYKHQKRRLKSLPLETPTEIELEPGNSIRVTLFDANHCPGAVMFLFEGNGKAVVYTGDIRSEPWHVNAIGRSPCMIEYSSGLKTLDRVYLDTSFTEDVVFQTKAEGLRELIEKVSRYPKTTKFYFSAWTYGYEEVWIALAKALDTQVHVDDYKFSVYKALQVSLPDEQYMHLSPEAPALTGFTCGNRFQPGILTRDETARLHSCEKGTRCSTMAQRGIVYITPIVAHLTSTSDMAEVGIGGGVGDLEQSEELVLSPEDARTLLHSASTSEDPPPDLKPSLPEFLLSAASRQHPISLSLPLRSTEDGQSDATDLQRALASLTKASAGGRGREVVNSLPNRIKFPYARHSSYRELCHLLQVLRPKDVWPCSVDPVRWIKEGLTDPVGVTIQRLFGDYCAGEVFQHDEYMAELAVTLDARGLEQSSQTTDNSIVGQDTVPVHAVLPKDKLSSQATTASFPSAVSLTEQRAQAHGSPQGQQQAIDLTHSDENRSTETQRRSSIPVKRLFGECDESRGSEEDEQAGFEDSRHVFASQGSSISTQASETRRIAFNSVLGLSADCGWPGLLSTTNNHTQAEAELGEPP